MGTVNLEDTVLPQVVDLMRDIVVWDNHGCMPLRPNDPVFLPQLARYHAAGVDVVSLNVGFDATHWESTVQVLAYFRDWLRGHADRYILVESVADIEQARQQRKLAVTFDIEGGCALNDQLSMVSLYYDLGVRWMLIAYNKNNSLGGGCQDEDTGLTAFGRSVLDEMMRVGMVICCSHTGFRTTLEVMDYARGPVIFSHSNALALWPHKRNIRDEAIRACAATGGVIGINGLGRFLGEYAGQTDARTETLVRHIDYVAQLVGADHVGLGLDYVFDLQELADFKASHPEMYPAQEGYSTPLNMVEPERIPQIAERLYALGYNAQDLANILGGNFLRVATQVWK